MKYIVHKSKDRGRVDMGWLRSHHSFSFGHWFHPEKMGFGLLRVINDDVVAPGAGFGTHPHRDMEIISVPLSGALEHKDSQGNQSVIRAGDVQLMSAGTGVAHSEYNHSKQEAVNFLQIWVHPEKTGIEPRYDQKTFAEEGRVNKWQTVVSPMDNDDGGVKINQQAYFSMTKLDSGRELEYSLKDSAHGVYVFVLKGAVEIGDETLGAKDALGAIETRTLQIKATADAEVLLIEVPMQ